MKQLLFVLLLFLALPLTALAQSPTATPSNGGGINVPYDFSPFAIPTVPPTWGIQDFDSGELIETTGRSSITTLSIANANNILAYIVILGVGWTVIMWLYHYIRRPASNSELNLSDAYKLANKYAPPEAAKFMRRRR